MLMSEILEDCKEILGLCSDEKIFSRTTDAVVVISNKGEFDPTLGYLDICACSDGRTVTLPRDVQTVLALNIQGTPTFFRNKWYEFHLNGTGSPSCGTIANGCNASNCDSWTWDDRGDVSTFMDIITPSYLIAVANSKNDLLVPLRVFGWDINNNEIRTQEADGTWRDGFNIPINLSSDFPNGIITPDSQRLFVRDFTTASMTIFNSVLPQYFATGALVQLSLVNSPLPTGLTNGGYYYVRVIDANNVTLHNSKSGALTDTDTVELTSTSTASVISLKDLRYFKVETKFQTVSAHKLATGDIIEFTAVAFPSPIVANTNYFAHVLDATNFTVHATLEDANSDTDPIDVTNAGTTVVALNKKPTNPITSLSFSVNHSLTTGDAVKVNNVSGQLPEPLIPGITYYVHYINNRSITLHDNLSDSQTGLNPIILLSSGTGSSTVQKTIASQVSLGTSSQISATSHGLVAGDFVQFTTDGTFPTPLAQNTAYLVASPYSDNTYTIQTAAGGSLNVTVLGTGQLNTLISRVFTVGFTSQWSVDAENITTPTAVMVSSTISLPAATPTLSSVTTYYARNIDSDTIELFTTSAYASDVVIRSTTLRSRAANVATLTTSAAHNLVNGDFVKIVNVQATRSNVLATINVTGGGAAYVNGDGATLVDGTGHTATGTLTVVAGAITVITVTDGGAGFTAAGALTITPNTAGAGATATVATVTASVVGLPNNYNNERVQITSTGATTFTYASTGLNEPSTADTAGTVRIAPIKISDPGVGDIFIVLSNSVTAVLDGSDVRVTSGTNELTQGALIKLETNGTLPAPLNTVTVYELNIVSDGIAQILDSTTHNQIVLTTIGSGTHDFYVQSDFTSAPPTFSLVGNNEYNDGDAVTFSTTDTLPSPLIAGTTYYLRRIDGDSVEIYDTSAHAINTASTTGRITLTSTGTGTQSINQLVDNILVKIVTRVQKGLSNSWIDLYAWDEGRCENLTLLGHYYGNETNPQYKRIRVNQNCCWVRIRYQKRIFKISNEEDFIPLTSKMALLFMIRALELYRQNFLEQAAAFEMKSVQLLEDEQDSNSGPESLSLQINSGIFINPNEQWME